MSKAVVQYLDPTHGEGKRQAQALLQYARARDKEGRAAAFLVVQTAGFPFPNMARFHVVTDDESWHRENDAGYFSGMDYASRVDQFVNWLEGVNVLRSKVAPANGGVCFCHVLLARMRTSQLFVLQSDRHSCRSESSNELRQAMHILAEEIERRFVPSKMAAARVLDLVAERAGGQDVARLVASFLSPFHTYKFATPASKGPVQRDPFKVLENIFERRSFGILSNPAEYAEFQKEVATFGPVNCDMRIFQFSEIRGRAGMIRMPGYSWLHASCAIRELIAQTTDPTDPIWAMNYISLRMSGIDVMDGYRTFMMERMPSRALRVLLERASRAGYNEPGLRVLDASEYLEDMRVRHMLQILREELAWREFFPRQRNDLQQSQLLDVIAHDHGGKDVANLIQCFLFGGAPIPYRPRKPVHSSPLLSLPDAKRARH